MTDDDQAALYQLEQERAREVLEALKDCRAHGATDEALMILAANAGLATEFRKEIQ